MSWGRGNSFDLSITPRFGWVRQVSYWINQFYLCTHAYSGVLLTLSAPTLHNKMSSCNFNFMQEFWENYKLNVQLKKKENAPRFERRKYWSLATTFARQCSTCYGRDGTIASRSINRENNIEALVIFKKIQFILGSPKRYEFYSGAKKNERQWKKWTRTCTTFSP